MTPGQVARLPLDGLVLAVVGVEGATRPLYRPLATWIAGWRLSRALDALIGGLPAPVILVMLAVPFALAEPMKVVGVYWMGSGHVGLGLLTIVLAYGTSVLVVERIYEAGKPKLLTIGWFAALVALARRIKDKALEGLHATRAWRASRALGARLRARFGR